MIDTPYHPYSDTRFTLNQKGTDEFQEGEGLRKSKNQ
jgi:hypothetical protein